MGRGRRGDGRGRAGPAERFQVDLTSVCVRRGAVQLPYRLKDAFSEGPVTAVDTDGGSTVELAFQPPRELAGLGGFFQAHALRANDSVALVFAHEGLQLQAIRRERTNAVAAPERGAAAPPGRASGAKAAPRATGSPRGTPGGSEAASSPTEGDNSAPSSAASPTPPSLRMEVPRTSVPADQRESAAAGAPRAGAPRWRPLDVMLSEEPSVPAQAAPAKPPAAAAPATSVVVGQGATVREVRHARKPASAERIVAPPRGDAAAGERSGAEAPPAAPSRGAARDPESVKGLFGLGIRLGRGGGARTAKRGDGPEGGQLVTEAARSRPAVAVVPPPLASGGREAGAGAAGAPAEGTGTTGGSARAGAVSDGAELSSAVETAAPDGPSDVHGSSATDRDEEAWEPGMLGPDVAAVRTYLTRPDVPAIVRTERVAEAVGLGVARVERALERVSEEWEHLSRIRAGAYMLRRPDRG